MLKLIAILLWYSEWMVLSTENASRQKFVFMLTCKTRWTVRSEDGVFYFKLNCGKFLSDEASWSQYRRWCVPCYFRYGDDGVVDDCPWSTFGVVAAVVIAWIRIARLVLAYSIRGNTSRRAVYCLWCVWLRFLYLLPRSGIDHVLPEALRRAQHLVPVVLMWASITLALLNSSCGDWATERKDCLVFLAMSWGKAWQLGAQKRGNVWRVVLRWQPRDPWRCYSLLSLERAGSGAIDVGGCGWNSRHHCALDGNYPYIPFRPKNSCI